MNSKEITSYAKLIAKADDGLGYINYVFERFEYETIEDRYLMCVRFPNWNHGPIEIGDIGYVHTRYVEGGIDKWFDGTNLISYRYTNIIFLKFIPEKPILKNKEIVLD